MNATVAPSRDQLIRTLFDSLDARLRPEDVAKTIKALIGSELSPSEQKTLQAATRSNGWSWSSMSGDYSRPSDMTHQLKIAGDLFKTSQPELRPTDAPGITKYVRKAEKEIGKKFGASDFKEDRLNSEQREKAGLGHLSKRRYNKMFRLASRMESKIARMEREIQKRELTLVSKSRLASKIKFEDFSASDSTAAFIAYMTARCNLRSEFTNTSQVRAYDTIADMLFKRCQRRKDTNWWAIAHIWPDVAVLNKLTDEQKGRLLAQWFNILKQLADLLGETWAKSNFRFETMIVQRGNDSSTWNVFAGAWNKARDGWINLLHALSMDDVLDKMCVGKAMRLMAADVARWHQSSGGGLEPDTLVWAALPMPWDVLDGTPCSREIVEGVCKKHGVDPVKKGWTAPKAGKKIEKFTPTPELVHGVTVGSPELAVVLRKVGVFSGKPVPITRLAKEGAIEAIMEVDNVRDEHYNKHEGRRKKAAKASKKS